jgi:uncharacterized membrane protein YhaH (DUF805 family)
MMIDDPESPRRLLLSLHGRIGRRTWWLWGVGAMLGLAIYFTVLLRVAGATPSVTDGLVNALLVWPLIALSAKRWHDRDKSAWWVLVALIPGIGWLWILIENGCLRGDAGDNRFGSPPQ